MEALEIGLAAAALLIVFFPKLMGVPADAGYRFVHR